MIQLEKPLLTGTMPVVWPTILDLGRDECKRILRKLGKLQVAILGQKIAIKISRRGF